MMAPAIAPPGFWHFAAACVVGALAMLGLLPAGDALGALSTVAATVAVAGLLLRRRKVNGRLVLEPAVLVVCVLYAWHFIFWVVYYAGLASPSRSQQYFNFAPAGMDMAFVLSLLAVFGAIAGAEAGMGRTPWRWEKGSSVTVTGVPHAAGLLGLGLVFLYVMAGGAATAGAYVDVFTEEHGLRRLYNLGIVLVLGATAPVLLLDSRRRWRLAFGLGVLLPTVLISAYLGSRWIVFSVLLLALAIRSLRGARAKAPTVVLLGIALALFAVVVKEFRAGSIRGLADAPAVVFDRHTNPLIELPEELGQTFLPVAGTVALIDSGEALRYGGSFGAAVLSIVPSGERLAGTGAERLPRELASVYVPERFVREGFTIGYSMVAELYANFGMLGVLLGAPALGYLLGRLQRAAVLRQSAAVVFLLWAVVAFAMFGIRNDLYTWLRYAVWAGVIFWLIGRSMDIMRERRQGAFGLAPS